MNPALLRPLFLAAIIAFFLYLRVRRNIGRQPFSTGRAWFRVAFLALVCFLIVRVNLNDAMLGGMMVGGALVGLALAAYALTHTQFEITPIGEAFYTPHPYIGLVVSALFLGRVIYRMTTMSSMPERDPWAAFHSPVTLGIYFVLAAYSIVTAIGLIRMERRARAKTG